MTSSPAPVSPQSQSEPQPTDLQPADVHPGSIVVGIDGSTGSDMALDWAVQQADLEHRPLTLVYSAHLGTAGDTLWLGQPGVDVAGLLAEIRTVGQGFLDDARRRALGQAPDLVVREVLSRLDPRDVLLALAEHATMVVVGSRGRGPVASLLLGSVSVTVSTHATCPVVVVRPSVTPGHGGILVDVDGTAESLPAIEFAYRAASLRALPLTAMYTYFDASHRRTEHFEPADDATVPEDVRLVLAESVAGMREKFPDVRDHLVVARGLRDDQLVQASHGRELVVVGSRQRGFVDQLLHGTVAPQVVEHASCDVAVVPSLPR